MIKIGSEVTFALEEYRPRVAIMDVTPEMAEEWLKNEHPNNRRLRTVSDKYADEMMAGGWVWTPEPIVFSADGFLVNGGNRMRAIIRSGMTILLTVWFDCPTEVFAAIDRGKTRALWQADSMGGSSCPRIVYQMARQLSVMDRTGRVAIDTDVRRKAADLLPAWKACAPFLVGLRLNGRLVRVTTSLAICIAWLSDPETAIGFLGELRKAAEMTSLPSVAVKNFMRWYENCAGNSGPESARDNVWAAAAGMRQFGAKQQLQFLRPTQDAWLFWRNRTAIAISDH